MAIWMSGMLQLLRDCSALAPSPLTFSLTFLYSCLCCLCRTPEEFAKAHAPGAVNIASFSLPGPTPLQSEFLEKLAATFPEKATKLVVACASGRRSKPTMAWMLEAGYTNLVENSTGWGGW